MEYIKSVSKLLSTIKKNPLIQCQSTHKHWIYDTLFAVKAEKKGNSTTTVLLLLVIVITENPT